MSYRFESWTDELGVTIGTTPTIQIVVNQDMTLIANYVALEVASVQGYVYTPGGIPLAGATVSINGVQTLTDSTGLYVFSSIAVGSYYIMVSATGYETTTVYIDVVSGVNNVPPITVITSTIPSGGCFIATAAYGTPLAPELKVLRLFRDKCLPNPITHLYYSISPPFADFIRHRTHIRQAVRTMLKPLIKTIKHGL